MYHQPLPSSWGTVCFGPDPRPVNDQTLTIRQTNSYELSPSGAGSTNSYLQTNGSQYQVVSAFVSRGQYEQLARENIRLAQELQQAKKDVETLKKACQDLSIWTYQERSKLMMELNAVTNGMASTSLDAMSEASIEPTPLQGGGYSYQRIGVSQPRHEGRGSGATNQFRHTSTYDIQSNVDGSGTSPEANTRKRCSQL